MQAFLLCICKALAGIAVPRPADGLYMRLTQVPCMSYQGLQPKEAGPLMCRGCEDDVTHLVTGMLVHMDDPDQNIRAAVCEVSALTAVMYSGEHIALQQTQIANISCWAFAVTLPRACC